MRYAVFIPLIGLFSSLVYFLPALATPCSAAYRPIFAQSSGGYTPYDPLRLLVVLVVEFPEEVDATSTRSLAALTDAGENP